MRKNVFITGFMGVGKSTVACDLAKYLVEKFTDLDHEVELLSRQPINDLTAKEGLEAVRKFEEQALKEIPGDHVVALGAGTLLHPENMRIVKNSGILIYLSADISTLIDRLTADKTKQRPLFGEYVGAVQEKQPKAELALRLQIANLLKERLPTYVKADFKIDTDGKDLRAITIEIEKRLRRLEQQAESSATPSQLR